MRLALAALEACLRDKRWGSEALEKERKGRTQPANVPVYGIGYRLQVKWAVRRGNLNGAAVS